MLSVEIVDLQSIALIGRRIIVFVIKIIRIGLGVIDMDNGLVLNYPDKVSVECIIFGSVIRKPDIDGLRIKPGIFVLVRILFFLTAGGPEHKSKCQKQRCGLLSVSHNRLPSLM